MLWLTTLSYALPELIGLSVALALLLTAAHPGEGRRLGLTGLAIMLAAALAGLVLLVVQTLWIQDAGDDLHDRLRLLNTVRVFLNLMSMAGLVTLVWGLCRATRPPPEG